jgi:hypothetical protein
MKIIAANQNAGITDAAAQLLFPHAPFSIPPIGNKVLAKNGPNWLKNSSYDSKLSLISEYVLL